MKYLLLLFPYFLVGQITTEIPPEKFTVGKVSPMGVFQSELNGYVIGTDTMYMVSLRDARYQAILEIFSIHLKASEKDEFYKILQDVFKEDKRLDVNIGTQSIRLVGAKSMGTRTVTIYKDGAYHVMMEKQLRKLFGK